MNPIQMTPAERSFRRFVLANLANFAAVIDVTGFVNDQRWSIQRVLDLYMEVLLDSPEIFYVPKTVQISYAQRSDGSFQNCKLTGIRYALSKSDLQRCKMQLDAEVRKAVAYAAKESSPEMIALRLHDYIVQICEYDTGSDINDNSLSARSAYSVLVRKKAVCEGYTMAYCLLMRKFIIPCMAMVSEKMNHCWNYVRIRGRWYHVDVTHDDPVFVNSSAHPVVNGLVSLANRLQGISRKNFLMSDAKARRNEHFGWDTRGLPSAFDVAYDNKIW